MSLNIPGLGFSISSMVFCRVLVELLAAEFHELALILYLGFPKK